MDLTLQPEGGHEVGSTGCCSGPGFPPRAHVAWGWLAVPLPCKQDVREAPDPKG